MSEARALSWEAPIRGVEKSNFGGTRSRLSEPHKTLRNPNGCIGFHHRWSPYARRSSYSVQESEAKRYRTPLHGAREGDDRNHTLLAGVATLLARFSLHDYDGQRGDKLLSNTKEVESEVSTVVRFPCGI